MQASEDQVFNSEAPLQLLLFVDDRPKSRQQVQRILLYFKKMQTQYKFELQVIDVGEQPYLAEHFKLIATPSLIKIHPEPKQTIAGSNIIAQLKIWWPRWQAAVETYIQLQNGLQVEFLPENSNHNSVIEDSQVSIRSVAASAELIRLSDEVFRLSQEKEKLEEQLQFKDRVISMLAHDLRNPLTAASIAIETLQNNFNLDKGEFERLTPGLAMHLFRQARSQTKIIGKMITDLLQVGRGKDRELPILPEKTNLSQLCLEALDELSDRFSAKSLKIDTDIPKDLPTVYADPERIRQVVINLLDNAIKYTPEGGYIGIAALHRTTQKVQFSISDSGLGIPEANRDRIFENHYRLERDESKDGYGIGLCLCQRIVRAHYGQIWVEESPSGGAWFHFTLPVYPK